jgi:carboxypeptidase Q
MYLFCSDLFGRIAMLSLIKRMTLLLIPLALLSGPLSAQTTEDAITRIKDEGMNRSQVMQTLSYLSDVIGPRLTASPNMKRANEWTKYKMTEWGLSNAHLEAWGPFGRGWTLERFSAQVVTPQNIPLIAYPKAWSPGWKGVHEGEVVYVEAKNEEELAKYKGRLKGAIVLSSPIREVKAHFESQGARKTDEELQRLESGQGRQRPGGGPGGAPPGARTGGRPGFQTTPEQRAQAQFAGRKMQFYQEEGVALVVDPSTRGDGGTLFVQSATVPTPPRAPAAGVETPGSAPGNAPGSRAGGGRGGAPGRRISPWDKDAPRILPQMVMATEQYNRLMRILASGEKMKMAVELSVKFHDEDLMAYNTIAELPGSDLKDQIVMLGAHMDSWHSGTGATDNGAGCAVVMEAVRILKALNLQPRRTIRVGLWSGEEEGLLGSRAYVTAHFGSRPAPVRGPGAPAAGPGAANGQTPDAPPAELTRKPEYDKLSAYYNLDNGTGKIRGIYLQGNEACRPIFREWLTPFKDMGAATVTISNTGGTDHQSFDGIGLPGFQFIQDEIEYDTRTHHSNQDVFDRIQADDLKQASVIMAAFIYNTAMRDEMVPRKSAPARIAP